MRITLLREDISLVHCNAMPKIKCVERNTALSVSQVAEIAHIGEKMKYLSSKTKLIVNSEK